MATNVQIFVIKIFEISLTWNPNIITKFDHICWGGAPPTTTTTTTTTPAPPAIIAGLTQQWKWEQYFSIVAKKEKKIQSIGFQDNH